MSIKATDLIALFRQALDEGWGYIWGTRGQTWTQAKQDAATRDMTVRYGQKWVGRRVADCSGLFVWAYKELGASIYHGSNTIYNKYTRETGAVAGTLSIAPGTAVFMVSGGKRTHIGLYIGGGKCIEAQGTRTGVVMSDLSRWDEWGTLTDVDCDLPAETLEIALRTLRKGDEGGDVRTMQELLIAKGYGVGRAGADGVFGGETQSAVRACQYDHGLKSDGICGPLTWAVLKATDDGDDADKPEGPPQSPTGDSSPQGGALSIEERLVRLELAVFGQEGGESDG